MTTLDLDALERAARAATPGEWEEIDYYAIQQAGRGDLSAIAVCVPSGTRSPAEAKANAAYLVAVQPTTILSLISDYRALQKRVEGAEGTLRGMQPHIDKIENCIRLNDEMGRVVVGQTEAAKALADLARAARTKAGEPHEQE